MARVLAIREVMLKPGVSVQEFERFVAEEWYPSWSTLPPDLRVSVLRGDRGDRLGRYIVVDEFASVEARNHHFPGPGEPTPEHMRRWMEDHGEVYRALEAKWDTYATTHQGVYTDFVEVGR